VVSGQPGSGPGFLSGLGDLDPKAIASLLPVLRELGEAQNSNARQLLFALRPYLKPERQDKVLCVDKKDATFPVVRKERDVCRGNLSRVSPAF